MTLEGFIRDSLALIVRGAIEADKEVRQHGGMVNPRPSGIVPKEAYRASALGAMTFPVSFDVAVTASEEAGSQAKIGVVAGLLGAGAAANETDSSSRVSRLKFQIYLSLPTTD